MDVTWFICMELVFLRQYINATVTMNSSTTLKQSQTATTSSGAPQSFKITSHITMSQVYENVSSTSEISSSSIYTQETESSTLMATKTSVPIEKSSSIIIPSNVSQMTSSSYVPILNESSTLKATKTSVPIEKSSSIITPPNVSQMTSSSYVPILNDKKKKSDGIPLVILIPSAAGGGIFLILIIILCCCVNRVLKRKKNERIFQKYYRPTRSSDLSHDIEDDNSNMWVSQVTKPSVESNEEQSTDSKHFKGISNRGFLKAESLPEMNIFQEHSPSNLSVNISTDTDQQNLNKVKGDIEEINESSEECKGPMKKIPETATVADDKAPTEEKPSCNDNNEASLLVLQNLDNILNDECPQDKPETSDAVTSLGDDQDKLKGKGGYCVVMYPFEASKTDEISLEVDTVVVAIESKPSGWSWVVNKDDNTGWCPTQYLLHVETDKVQDECEDVQIDHRGYSIPDQRRLKFAVLQSFFGTSPNELSLSKYDIVTVIKNSSSGWSWVTKPSVGSGWFPTDYLEPLIFPKNETSNSSNESSKYLDVINEDLQYASSEEIQKVKKEGHYQEYEAKAYRATHPYTGSKEDELTFKENETILVLQESETGWWRGSTFLGEGWFPATFVEDPINEDPGTTSDHHECVEPPKYQEKDAASPYEVTELVTRKGQTKKESDREMVHQVPQVIPSDAAKKHKNRGRGKASNLKPCRPAPPPPPGERLDGQFSPQQSVFSFTPDVSPVSEPSTCEIDAPPQAPLLPEVNPVDPIQSSGKVPSYITVPPPSPLPEDVHANIQENSDSVDNVEGVVIVPSRDQSQNTLSKLIKVTKRRSVINPNPHATPPNRPVPVPPPRKVRSPQKSADKLPRPRPIKAPRNLGNKNPDPQNIRNVPEDVPERPPPPVPEKLEEFRNKRLSSGERSLSQLQSSNIPREQSENVKNNGLDQNEQDGNNHNNQCNESELETCLQPKSKQRNGKAGNYKRSSGNLQDERQSSKNKESEKTGGTSPKPRPRQRSQDQQFDLDNNNSLMQQQSENDDPNTNSNQNLENATTTSNKMPHLSEQSSPGERRDSAPEASPRSRSICDESSDNQPKIRPQIKPRSKSLANLFSSDNDEKNAEDNCSSDSEKRFRLHSSPEDESRQPSRKSFESQQSQNPQRPKPKTRAK